MQAIRTKYYGPTDTTGSCIRAKCQAGSIRMPYRHELDLEENHEAACRELCLKLGWAGNTVLGFVDGVGYHVVRQPVVQARVQGLRRGRGGVLRVSRGRV